MEGGDGVGERFVAVFARVEDPDDALDSAVDLEFGEEGERVERGVGRWGEIVEEEGAGGRGARGEDGCVTSMVSELRKCLGDLSGFGGGAFQTASTWRNTATHLSLPCDQAAPPPTVWTRTSG